MSLPIELNGLERYLSELPKKIESVELDLVHYTITLDNKLVNIHYYEAFGHYELSCFFKKFIMPQKYILNLSGKYILEEKRAKVWAMVLRDKKDNTIDHEQSEHCTREELMQRPQLLLGATDFLNRVLDKYDFYSYYEEFQRRRNEQKGEVVLLK